MSGAPVPCAAEGCSTHVQRGMLMCKPHWFSLPKPLRDEVWRTWRAFNGSRGAADKARLTLMADYREAVRAAVDYLRDVPTSPAAVFRVEARKAGKTIRFEQGRLL